MKSAVARNLAFIDPPQITGKAPIVRAARSRTGDRYACGRNFSRASRPIRPMRRRSSIFPSCCERWATRPRPASANRRRSTSPAVPHRQRQRRRAARPRADGAGDFMTNTPIEFLLEDSDTTLLLAYVDAETKSLDDLPPHDIAFVAVGDRPKMLPSSTISTGFCGAGPSRS